MSNEEDGFLSDEDMFSPKKCRPQTEEVVVERIKRPGAKERLLNTFKRMLTGIPPPPDFTNPDFHLDKLLTTWQENQHLLWEQSSNFNAENIGGMSPLGICLNEDNSCEEFELTGRQICERFIWSETSAVTSTAYLKLTQSAKKRRKANGWGLSPRTRISYLTRRMTTFQKDNIAAAVASNKTTQILVAKNDGKKSVGPSKGANLKGKRMLFQSPENKNKFRTPEQSKNRRSIRRLVLNPSPRCSDKNGLRTVDRPMSSSEKKRCSRSLFTSKGESSGNREEKQDTPQNNKTLSSQHRQKMLWAVSNALKAVKIRMMDPEFKSFASHLFKATLDKWKSTSNPSTGDKKISTSDSMLATAKSLVEGVTGRRMSPKSAKKTANLRTRTPDKSIKRDENNPPSGGSESACFKISEAGVFPLEHVGVLSEKVDPGGNASNFRLSSSPPSKIPIVDTTIPGRIVEESPEIRPIITAQSRKRKRDPDDERAESNFLSLVSDSPRVLRTRTPSKSLVSPQTSCSPTKLTCSVVKSPVMGTIVEESPEVSPLVEVGSLRKCTRKDVRTKSIDNDSTLSILSSPRLLRTRTPSKTPRTPQRSWSPSKSGCIAKSLAMEAIVEQESKILPSTDVASSRKRKREDADNEIISEDSITSILVSPRLKRIGSPLRRRTPKKLTFQLENPDEVHVGDGRGASVDDVPTKLPGDEISPQKRNSTTPAKSQSKLPNASPRTLRSRTPSKLQSPTNSERRTPKKVLFAVNDNEDEKHKEVDECCQPPVLRAEGLRRTSRRISGDLKPPLLKIETTLSSPPPLDWVLQGWTSPTDKTPLTTRRRSSGTTPTKSCDETEGQSGKSTKAVCRRRVSLSLGGSVKKKSPPNEK